MELTFIEIGKNAGEAYLGEANEVLSFGYVKFELLNSHLKMYRC